MKPSNKRKRQCEVGDLPKKATSLMSDSEFEKAFYHFEAKRARREALELLALVKPSGCAVSHMASQDLQGHKHLISRAADEGMKNFFIELGKLLEGKRLKPNTWSKWDRDVAFILCFHTKIKSSDAVELLERLGHPKMSSLAFKQMRYNWKRAALKTRERWEEMGWKYGGNSFLDDGTA
jgi:hypothetical protein